MATQDRQQPKHDASTCQNAEPDGDSSDSDTNGVVSVHIERLRRPEHEDREEVGARDECNDERKTENARLLTQTFGEHGVLCAVCLPPDEGDDENSTQDEWCEDMCRAPGILVSGTRSADGIRSKRANNIPSPLHSHHEEKHSADR